MKYLVYVTYGGRNSEAHIAKDYSFTDDMLVLSITKQSGICYIYLPNTESVEVMEAGSDEALKLAH